MKILLLLIPLFFILPTLAITIDNTNFIINSSSFNTTFSSNQTYNSIESGTDYLNLSYNSTEYINFTSPITSGTEVRVPYTIIGSYFIPSGTVVVNNVNRTMTYTPTYLYFDTSELFTGTYITSKFYVNDSIGEKIITLRTNLTTTPTNDKPIGGSGGYDRSGGGGGISWSADSSNITNVIKTVLTRIINNTQLSNLGESIPKLDKQSLIIYSAIVVVALLVVYYVKPKSPKQYYFTKRRL